jgi:hypothetical protein
MGFVFATLKNKGDKIEKEEEGKKIERRGRKRKS